CLRGLGAAPLRLRRDADDAHRPYGRLGRRQEAMRVTTLQSRDQRIGEILREEERLQTAQDQVSTGLRIQRPSDDPHAIAELLRTHSDVAGLTQQKESATAALTTMQA